MKTTRVEVYERGRPAAGFPLAGRGSEALTPFPYALGLEQDRTEELLVEGLAEHGRGVDWNTELRALVVDGDEGATAVVRRADGIEDTVSARWVVGADGASSPVRRAVGLGFVGKTYAQTGLLADVELDAPAPDLDHAADQLEQQQRVVGDVDQPGQGQDDQALEGGHSGPAEALSGEDGGGAHGRHQHLPQEAELASQTIEMPEKAAVNSTEVASTPGNRKVRKSTPSALTSEAGPLPSTNRSRDPGRGRRSPSCGSPPPPRW